MFIEINPGKSLLATSRVNVFDSINHKLSKLEPGRVRIFVLVPGSNYYTQFVVNAFTRSQSH
jgi:hypothetical protein